MEAKANLKEMTFKKKVEHIWEYYRYPIFGIILAIYIAISTIYSQLTAKECLMKILMINGSVPYDGTIFAEDFLLSEGFDLESQEVLTSCVNLGLTEKSAQQDYYSIQAILARLTSGDIDIMTARDDIFRDYVNEGYFLDLTTVFTSEELASYEECLIYVTNPETNETYPCAFDLSTAPWVTQSGYFDENSHFGIIYNCPRIENAKRFLIYLLDYEGTK